MCTGHLLLRKRKGPAKMTSRAPIHAFPWRPCAVVFALPLPPTPHSTQFWVRLREELILGQQSGDHDPDYAEMLKEWEERMARGGGDSDDDSEGLGDLDSEDDDDDDDEEFGGGGGRRRAAGKKRKKASKSGDKKKKPVQSVWPRIWMQFWGAHQRFFRSLCISCKVAPTPPCIYFCVRGVCVCVRVVWGGVFCIAIRGGPPHEAHTCQAKPPPCPLISLSRSRRC